jgi:hypothetical protein
MLFIRYCSRPFDSIDSYPFVIHNQLVFGQYVLPVVVEQHKSRLALCTFVVDNLVSFCQNIFHHCAVRFIGL